MTRNIRAVLLLLGLVLLAVASSTAITRAEAGTRCIWVCPEQLHILPTRGPAWSGLLQQARAPIDANLSNQDDLSNVRVLARALAYVRTGDEQYRREVLAACKQIIGTEQGGRTLALGRELAAYVIAADLVGLPEPQDQRFKAWLREVRHATLSGQTLISTHEDRPNNWGTHAGASRMAIARYLQDDEDLAVAITVFRTWLGDSDAHTGFRFRELHWQADPQNPVGINPAGAVIDGHSVDGVLADDQRRCCERFTWPPPKENYVYEGLQGALVQAVILHQAGYTDVWEWGDRALLRAFRWLHDVAQYPAQGDDTWQPHIVNYYYGTNFPAVVPSRAGKNVGFTDWTHGFKP